MAPRGKGGGKRKTVELREPARDKHEVNAEVSRGANPSDPSGKSRAKARAVFQLPTPPKYERPTAMAVFVVALAMYTLTMQPSVSGGDSGELMTVAHEWGTAHPPGYPLFTIYSKISEIFLSRVSGGALDAGMAMNLGHTVLSAAAVVFLFLAGSRLSGLLAPGILAAGIFAFSPAVWTYAVVTEVFAMNNFFVCLLLLLCVVFYAAVTEAWPSRLRILYFSSFVCGLASTNQHTVAVYLLPLVLWVFLIYRAEMSVLKFIGCTLCYIMGISPYLYLIWSALYIKSKQSWGDCLSFSGLMTHLLRKEYGTFHLASKEARFSGNQFWQTSSFYFNDLHTQTLHYGWLCGALGIVVILWTAVRQRTINGVLNVQVLFVVMYVFYLIFFNYLTNFPLDNPLYVGVVQRFWIQPLSIVCLFIGHGCGAVQHYLSSRKGRDADSSPLASSMPTAFTGLAVSLVGIQCALHYEMQDMSTNYIVRDFGRSIMLGLPNSTILLTKGDLMINSARYVQSMEGLRPDVIIADQEMMTYSWYVTSLKHNFPTLRFPPGTDHYFPGKPTGFTVKQFLDLNLPNHQVFLCYGWKSGDNTWQGFYDTRPWGLSQQVIPVDKVYSPKSLRLYINQTHNVPPREGVQLPPHDKLHLFPPHAWEHIVLNDYYASIQGQAYYLMQFAERKRDQLQPNVKDIGWVCLLRTLELYGFLFETQKPEASAIVYRNYGVALQTLLSVQQQQELPRVIRIVDTFTKYIEICKRDNIEIEGGEESMVNAVNYWSNFRDSMIRMKAEKAE